MGTPGAVASDPQEDILACLRHSQRSAAVTLAGVGALGPGTQLAGERGRQVHRSECLPGRAGGAQVAAALGAGGTEYLDHRLLESTLVWLAD